MAFSFFVQLVIASIIVIFLISFSLSYLLLLAKSYLYNSLSHCNNICQF